MKLHVSENYSSSDITSAGSSLNLNDVNEKSNSIIMTGYCNNNKVNSASHPSGVGKSRTGLHGWGYGGAHSTVLGGT